MEPSGRNQWQPVTVRNAMKKGVGAKNSVLPANP
jgi:hypothetical protein